LVKEILAAVMELCRRGFRTAQFVMAGLTRPSIFFARLLRRSMDTRVKPAYDGFWCDALRLIDSTGYWIARFRGR
jgi:hypothetical protein